MSYNRAIVYPYNVGSHSARALAQALNSKCVRPNGTYQVRIRDLVINWGSTTIPNWWGTRAVAQCFNKPQYVANASDKIRTLQVLLERQVPCVEFTTSRDVAVGWLTSPRFGNLLNAVVCRTLTRASQGRGIVLARSAGDVVPAPLYTRYTPKQEEYRIHVFRDGTIIDVQQKRRMNGFVEEGNNNYLRNHDNGWVFCRQNVTAPDSVLQAAQNTILALNLDFGAVDVGHHKTHGTFVYEINTAPGIEGQTISNYANKIRNCLST